MAITAGDLVKRSLRLITVLEGSESPSADELQDGLLVLNQMLDTWSADGNLPPAASEVQATLTAGQSKFTIGPTGDIVTATRPVDILNFVIRDTSNGSVDYRIQKILKDRWWAITQKDTESRPYYYFFEQTYPDATIRFDSEVDSSNYKAIIAYVAPFTVITGATDSLAYPPGYEEAFAYNLAVRYSAEYGHDVRPVVIARADELLQNIRMRYVRVPEMAVPVAAIGRGRYNIFSDGGG